MPYWGTKSRAVTIKNHPLKFGRSHKNGYKTCDWTHHAFAGVGKKLPVTKNQTRVIWGAESAG